MIGKKSPKKVAPKKVAPVRVEVDRNPQGAGPTVYTKVVDPATALDLKVRHGFRVIAVSGDRVTVAADSSAYRSLRGGG